MSLCRPTDVLSCISCGPLILDITRYDYSGPWDLNANHQANLFGSSPDSLSSDRAIRFYTSQGVSVEKLVLGPLQFT